MSAISAIDGICGVMYTGTNRTIVILSTPLSCESPVAFPMEPMTQAKNAELCARATTNAPTVYRLLLNSILFKIEGRHHGRGTISEIEEGRYPNLHMDRDCGIPHRSIQCGIR